MDFMVAVHTDVGLVKKVNQDSLLVEKADTDVGPVVLAVLCDGMGGLAFGEVASACMVNAYSDWFRGEFPQLLHDGLNREALRNSWDSLVRAVSLRIMGYGRSKRVNLGTTCVALLIVDGVYYLMNVGDSRIYLISNNIYQLTKDQTYVQQEIDAGRMTREDALSDPRKNALLQCIGAGEVPVPEYAFGSLNGEQCFLLCCDGFRHVVGPEEFYAWLNPTASTDEDVMQNNLKHLTELNKERNETDNITAILIRTCGR